MHKNRADITSAAAADAELAKLAERSARLLQRAIRDHEPRIARAQAIVYYRRHIRRFERQEVRYVDFVENFASVTVAKRVKHEIESGTDLASMTLHEVVERFHVVGDPTKEAEDAIFAARPHVLMGPVRLNAAYSIFRVTRILPPRRQSFAAAERAIEQLLAHEQQQSALERFLTVWRGEWIAKTDCARGYVVSDCAEYSGFRGPEDLSQATRAMREATRAMQEAFGGRS